MLKSAYQKAAENESIYAIAIAWTVGLLFFTLAGFYFTTIAISPHYYDLQVSDMEGSVAGGAIGFFIGVVVALVITLAYPKITENDARHEAEHHDEQDPVIRSVH